MKLLNKSNWWQIILADFLLVILAFLLGFVFSKGVGDGVKDALTHWRVGLLAIGISLLCYYYFGLYHIETLRDKIRLLFSAIKACAASTLLLIAYVFAFEEHSFPKDVMLAFFLLDAILLFSWRAYIDTRLLLKSARETRRVLIVGAGNAGARIATQMRDSIDKKHEIVGFVDDNPEKTGSVVSGFEILGTRENIREIIKEHRVDRVVIAMPSVDRATISDFILICDETSTEYSIVPSFYEIITQKAPMDDTANLLLMSFFENRIRREQKIVKRIFDVVVSSISLIVLSPIFLLAAIAVKLSSKGPIIFAQTRVMRGGKLFKIYKFRTMVQDADKLGPVLTERNDPRITRIGKFLRYSSIDELPQLVNVLKGEMSLVGPRPEVPSIVAEYERWQRRVLDAQPGVTGLAQISGRDDLSINAKLRYDMYYMRNHCLSLDIKIILKTFKKIIDRQGAN
ncbi:MAG: sugar transferase [Candidatus Coatesbacteria bacterium]|nr:sugar transferase [Candidatus Coatesbacteria bacterium]